MGGNGGVGGTGTDYGGGGGGGGYGAAIVIQGTGETSLDGQFYGGGAGAGGTGSIEGGGGGAGGAGLAIIDSDGGKIVLSSTTSAFGGAGGTGTGGGGSGGAGLIVANGQNATTLTSDAKLYGGIGGLAFNGALGGAGGSGLIIATSGASGSITANINGEVQGGAGGPSTGGSVPIGGDGGVGIYVGNPTSPSNSGASYLNVNANVTGGAGGAGGIVNPFPAGGPGGGGAGIIGYNSTITVADGVTVSGGNGGVNSLHLYEAAGIAGSDIQVVLQGTAQVKGGARSSTLITIQGAAVAFTGGANTLELQADEIGNLPTLSGRVLHNQSADTLVFGGAYNATMDAATLGPLAYGFSSISKTGTSTWTLTGDLSASTPTWRLKEGTLSISDDKSLGGTLTLVNLDGGTLAVTENVQTGISFNLVKDAGELSGTLSIAANKTLTLDSLLGGSGTLTKSGAGTLALTANNFTYRGAVIVSDGTLALSGAGSLSAAKSVTLGKATLDISATTAGATINDLSSADSGARVVLGSQTLSVTSSKANTFAGVISGNGGLTVSGALPNGLILTGDNTYLGTTTVNGALAIGFNSASGSVAGDIVVNAGGNLGFARNDTYTIQNSITAAAGSTIGFVYGTYSYAGSGVISGAVFVQGGELHLIANEFANASSLTLDSGGTLSGNGTVVNLVVKNGGIVAPGNSPGTIAVNGTVELKAGSTYRVDVTPTGAHDLIIASGAATIESTAMVQLVAEAGRYKPTETYAILTATGGVTGTFASVEEDYAFLDGALSYDANNVYLTLTSNSASFTDYARTPNQLGTATAAQTLGSGNAIYDALLMLPENAAPAAFDALSGEAYASVSSVLQQQSIYVRDAVSGRLRQALTAPGVSPLAYGPGPVKAQLAEGYTPTLWAQGYGGWGNSWSNGNAASISNTIGGFLMGADVSVAENARAGLFGGYSRSTFDVDGRSSSGSANNYDLGLYAGAQFGAVALRGGASYTWHDLSVSRSVVFPGFAESLKGNDTTGTAQVFGEIGYDVDVGAIAFEPFLGLAYVNVSGASLGEEGGAAALSVSTDDMSTVYSTLGVRLATTVEVGGRTLTPYATLGWQHAFGDVTPSSTMQFAGGLTPFSVSGVPVAEDALLVEAGLSYALSANAQIGATYAGQLSGEASQNAFTAQFSLKF